MRRDNVNYLVVGSFVICMLIAFFAFMYFVTGRTGPADMYTVIYKNVSGLKFGSGVFYEGYRVGQVESIEPSNATTGTTYELTLSITQGWNIPEDSIARIAAAGLISAVQIEITGGHSENSIKPGGEIHGLEQQNLFAVLSEAAGEIHSLSEDGIMPVMNNLNGRIDELSREIQGFRREELSPLVATFNKRLNEDLMGDANALIAKFDDSAQQLEKILGSSNQKMIGDFLLHIDSAAVNFDQLLTRIEVSRKQMDDTLAALKNLTTDNDEKISNAVENATASMQQFHEALTTTNEHLGTILYNVEGTSRQLHEFSQAVRDNPALILRGTK